MNNSGSKEAIDKIQELVEKSNIIKVVDGKSYTAQHLNRVYSDPKPDSLDLSSLDGLTDYINKNIDNLTPEGCMIVVNNPKSVSLYAPVGGEENDRYLIALTKLKDVNEFQFGRFLGQEEFIISFSSLFKGTDDKTKILKAVSSMQIIDQKSGDDNGATINKQTSKEVLTPGIDQADMPKTVVKLKPYRTFREVEQPESAFIFRFKENNGSPVIALFEADGGAWKLEAKQNIKKYLADSVDSPIIC